MGACNRTATPNEPLEQVAREPTDGEPPSHCGAVRNARKIERWLMRPNASRKAHVGGLAIAASDGSP